MVVMTMTTDLCCLILLGLLTVPLAHLPSLRRMRGAGTAWGLGNRDTPPPPMPAWVERADRAHRNLLDNLPFYAISILVVALLGKQDGMSATASMTLLGARLAHAALYIGGVTFLGLRSGAYFVALGACLVILSRLL